MGRLGEALNQLRSPIMYGPRLGVGLWRSVLLTVAVFAVYSIAQGVLGLIIAAAYFGDASELSFQVRGMILATLPAACVAVALCYFVAGMGGGDPRDVLSLRSPQLTVIGWIIVLLAFLIGLYFLMAAIVTVFNIDLSQYSPKSDGSSPDTGSAGLVKEAMFALSNNPAQFWMAFVSVTLGAPLAEEFIFRGQFFAALANSRLGRLGTVAVTSVLWAALHLTEPILSVFLVLIMGFILGWLLLRFRSLYLTMVCHGVWNGVYSLIVHYGQ